MQISRTTPQLPAPPPRLARARLLDGTGDIGWIGDQSLGFTGFATPNDAVAGAWVAHIALERRAAKSRREPAPYIEATPQLARDGENEWIEVADKRIARLLRPVSGHVAGGDEEELATRNGFGFEILFPPTASSLDIDSSAHVVYRGLRRAAVPWAIRRAPVAKGAPGEADTTATLVDIPQVPHGDFHGATPEVEHAPAA